LAFKARTYASNVFRGEEGVRSLEQANAAAPRQKIITLNKIRMQIAFKTV